MLAILGLASLALFVAIVVARGWFWLPGPVLPARSGYQGKEWPGVVAVVPARDEADLLGETLATLAAQDYRGRWRVVLVDDNSTDGTGELARKIGARVPCTVLTGSKTPEGWAGKVWAMSQGVASAEDAEWLLLTDADICHDSDVVTRLVALALEDERDLVSIMAELSTATGWERLVVPAFVYFFAMLYPFRWVSGSGRVAAAAGGCVLVRAEMLARSGGLGAMKGAIIDDVQLAQQIKGAGGRLWLGIDAGVRSIRPYPRLADLWQMVARSAYDELDYSPLRLLGALAGLALLFAVPLVTLAVSVGLAIASPPTAGTVAAMAVAASTLALQAASYLPTIRLYRLSPWWALTLPAAGLLYGSMTASSALAHKRGRG
ncbi:MAG: glycosyltransferase, partial [Acidimicrobiales bacterium]